MPRRKKLPKVPNYEGTAQKPDSMLVQKANPLQTLSETKMTLAEFKILDAYLSRIDSHKSDERYVRFEKGELEKLLGVTQIKKEDLSKRIDNLFQVVTIRDEHKPKKFTKIALFAKAECEQDENGQWQVDLACSAEAMEYIFNIENIGYLKYRLKNVVDLTSRYSYVLYLYLENNRFRKSWNIPLNDLKALLRCTAERYEQYKFFNSEILKKCHKELNEKTNIKYSYEPIKSGRKVTAIQFSLETVSDKLSPPKPVQQTFLEPKTDTEQLTFNYRYEDELTEREENEINYGGELANLLGNVSCEDEFSPEQIRVLQDLVIQAVSYADHLKYCDYLSHKVHIMNLYKPKKENRFTYLVKMIKNDIKDFESV